MTRTIILDNSFDVRIWFLDGSNWIASVDASRKSLAHPWEKTKIAWRDDHNGKDAVFAQKTALGLIKAIHEAKRIDKKHGFPDFF